MKNFLRSTVLFLAVFSIFNARAFATVFTPGNPATGVKGAPITADWLNAVEAGQKGPGWAAMRNGYVERVAWVGLGDSNELLSGYGWNNGISKALSSLFGLWGTGVQAIYNNYSSPTGAGGYDTAVIGNANETALSAPTEISALWPATMSADGATHMGIIPYCYIPSGTATVRLEMVATNYGGKGAPYRYHYTYSKNSGWSGSFRPAIRLGTSPYTQYVQAASSISTAGSVGLVDGYLDLPANSIPSDTSYINAGLNGNSDSVTGPFWGTVQQIENLNRTTGFSYQTLYFYGGRSARQMLQDLNEFGSAGLAEYLRQVRRLLGPNNVVIININMGMNDRNDSNPSIGPTGGFASDTEAGYQDNIQGVINLIRSVYSQQGWSQDYLYFFITPSHPVSTPDDTKLGAFRTAAKNLAKSNSNTFFCDLAMLMPSTTLTKANYYDTGGTAHLSAGGYDAYGAMLVAFYSGASSTALTSAISASGDETISGNKTFTGTVAAPTPSTSDNSTIVATTAFVTNVLKSPPTIGLTTPNVGYFSSLHLSAQTIGLAGDGVSFQVTNNMHAYPDATYNLGVLSQRWKDIFLSGIVHASKLRLNEVSDIGIAGDGVSLQATNNFIPYPNNTYELGTPAFAWKTLWTGSINLVTTDAKPLCTSSYRGTFWVTRGAAGVKDSVEVCTKDAADAYNWRILW